ncbi:MAG: mandelate racemase, partial [Acidobacteriaceae bacterium]
MKREFSITGGAISLYTIPTEAPEADGTISWDSTSMVLVQLECGATQSLGYTYADAGTAAVADLLLKKIVLGSDPLCHAATWQQMLRQVRNLGET